ncbi:hypothetical protein [Flagellimonas sp.]|uniref:hypothetical protein n=1 Tax=Flagellimonas sp. TaxID=2058762 RepID=UPI003B5B1E1D
MLKRTTFFYLLLVFVWVGCGSDSEEIPTDDDIQLDNTPPTIQAPETPNVIQVLTDLYFTIQDDSNELVNRILLDGEEIFSSTAKSFNFQINPFDYSSGPKNLKIVSVDDSGNESTVEISFELKKLLVRIPNPSRGTEAEVAEDYYAINDLTGKLLAYKKVEMEEVLDFFADDSFSHQNITLTRYTIGKSPQSFQFFSSVSDIPPGTILPTDEERGTAREQPGTNSDNNIEILVESTHLPVVHSHNAILQSFSGFSGSYRILYNNSLQNGQSEVLFSFPTTEVTAISEYEYLLINDFDKSSYELAEFKKPNSFVKMEIPENTGSYYLSINGFYDESDYQNYKYRRIFENGDEISMLTENALEVPVLEEFEVFQRQLSITEGKKRFQTSQKGIAIDFFIPDFDISRTDDLLNFSGDYDYSEFFFDKVSLNGDGSINQFFWRFKNRPTTSALRIPYYDFELPMEINEELSMKSLSANPNEIEPDSFSCQSFKFDATGSYEDIVFFTKEFADGPRGDEYILNLDLK